MIKISEFVYYHPWISLGLTLLFLFGFQLLNIIYGFDIHDTGFHLVAYENVFNAPDSVTYNFVYYLNTLLGGAIMYIFPDMGVLGFRIVGALLVLFTLLIIFVTLRNTIPAIHLLLGSILVVAGYVNLPYSFNNAILSCCLYAISIVLLFQGLFKENKLLVLLGGIIVGINIFTRIPNVLAVGLVLIILLYKKSYLKINIVDWRNVICFLIGIGLGILVVLGIMVRMGHIKVFLNSLLVVFSMAGGESSHNLLWMLKIHFAFYLSALIPLLVLYALIHIEKRVEKNKNKYIISSFYIVSVLSVALYVYETPWVYVIIWGFLALGCVICILRNKNQLGILAIFALYMLIFEIYGSDYGINHGSLPAFIAAPIASMQLLDRKKIVYVLTFVLAVCWQIVRKGNFQDAGPIYQKTEKINCLETKGIFTTKENAYAINTTLKGIKPYVSVGDTMICFPSAAMMNYLTHTRPAGGMSVPGGTETSFVLPIEGTPIVLFNKVPFSGNGWTETYKLDHKYGFDIKSFISEHNYRKVYENDYFILFVPPVF